VGNTSPTSAPHRRHLACQERKRKILELAAKEGMTREAMCAEVGMSVETLRNWRQRDKQWWARYLEVRRLAKESPEQAEQRRIEHYDGGFVSFRRHYLHMETTWFQQMAIDAIERTRPGEVTMILWPPEHGKTTLLADYCTYKIANNNGYRITVASETEGHGIKILGRIQGRFKADGPTPAIAKDFGPLAPEDGDKETVWQARRFNVVGRRIDEGDYNMCAVGITGRIQGTRCDLLLLDDMQDLKSLELSAKYFDLVKQSFLSRPSVFGRTVLIGTRVGEFDVYRQLMESGVVDHLVTIPAYDVGNSPTWLRPKIKPDRDDPSTWAPEGIKFLWPDKYDVVDPDTGESIPGFHRFAYANLRFRMGEQTWWRIYMQRPEAAASMTFDEVTTDAMKDEHRGLTAQPRPREDGSPVPIIIGVDPAVGGGNGVLTAAGYPTRMEVLHCRLDYELTKYSQIIDLIEEECFRYSTPDSVVTTVVVEDKAFQKGLLQDDRMTEVQRRFGFRIVPNTTGSLKKDPDIGVPGMPMAMIRQEITIPWADEAAQDNMGLLLDQLHIWRPGTRGNTRTVQKDKVPQDLTMALWFAWGQWRATRDTPVHPTTDPSQFNRSRQSPLRSRVRRPTVRRRSTFRSLQGGRR
jgi:predicted secreted protein